MVANFSQPTSSNYTLNKNGANKSNKTELKFAPFNGIVIGVSNGLPRQIYFRTQEKVFCSDGTYRYVTAIITHDKYLSDKMVGCIYPQGYEMFDIVCYGTMELIWEDIEIE